ncbi:hypothetical protein CRUP_017851 [Coryphaenoides rupestris]|nr:hypothetical protein CRUP_017851 [Coryphaenoides rupestris]
MGNKEVYEFPVSRWFAMDEDDGKIQRDILVGSSQPMAIVYNVQVMTGDVRGAGTNSKIHIVLHGTKGTKNSGKVFLEGGAFERALIDTFNVEICELISPLSRVTIGHDNGAVGAGWYCEKVPVSGFPPRVTVYCPFTGIEQTFPCGRWLDEDEADGLIERELYEMVSLRQQKLKKYPWTLWIFTSDIKGAGTDAQVFLQIYGELGKSDEMKMENNSDSFEQGQVDKFMIELPELGPLQKIRIWHEKRNPFAGWHLAKVTLMKTLTKEKYSFDCGRWLDINEDDNEIYRVTICTGDVSGSGTDASVFLNVIGDLGDTGERLMFMSKNNVNKFESGNHDEFLIESVFLGQVRRVRVGHDGRGGGCGWYLDKVLVREEGQPESVAIEFPCDRPPRCQLPPPTSRVSNGRPRLNVTYQIAIMTGSINGASSDSKVFVKLYGDKGDTCKMLLMVSENDLSNYFETGRTDVFTVETFDIGEINRLLIGHTNEGLRAGWYLDSVQISVPVHGKQYMFPSHRWLCKDEADGKVEVEIYPSEILDIEQMINYEVTVTTGDLRNGGTNANVFCQIYGEDGRTQVLDLKNRSNNFERGTTEIFKVEAHDVGKIYKIRIGHDGRGIGDGWFLEGLDIKRLTMGMVQVEVKVEPKKEKKKDKKKKKKKEEEPEVMYIEELREVVETLVFECHRWLARDEEDGEIVVELLPEDSEDLESERVEEGEVNSYDIHVFTGSLWGAGTDANVYITITGEVGDTGERRLRRSNRLNKFESNQGYEGVRESETSKKKSLPPMLDSNMNKKSKKKKEEEVVEVLPIIPYHITVATGVERDGSTSSRAFVVIFGAGDVRSDRLWLDLADGKSSFDEGSLDSFDYYFPCKRWLAVEEDDGQIARELVPKLVFPCGRWLDTGEDDGAIIRELYPNPLQTMLYTPCTDHTHNHNIQSNHALGHDGATPESCWLVDELAVAAPTKGVLYVFACKCWLAKDRGDGLTSRLFNVLDAETIVITRKIIYEVTILTGDVQNGGTDTQVYMSVFGLNGSTDEMFLKKNEDRWDVFNLEIDDVAPLKKMRVRIDGSGSRPDWFLDRAMKCQNETKKKKVVLRNLTTEEECVFTYEDWLSRTRGLKRTLVCEMAAVLKDSVEETSRPCFR